jgi:hypothetical protein
MPSFMPPKTKGMIPPSTLFPTNRSSQVDIAFDHRIQAIPTPYMKRQSYLKRLFGRLTFLNLLFMFTLLGVLGFVYAWKVALTSRLATQTEVAKTLYEENTNLEVELNQLRSFQHIQDKIATVPHLVLAKEKIQIQSTLNDWKQPLLLGDVAIERHPDYVPLSGF